MNYGISILMKKGIIYINSTIPMEFNLGIKLNFYFIITIQLITNAYAILYKIILPIITLID